MKKSIKVSLIVIAVIIGILLIDTMQALIFNNSPLFKIPEYYNGGTLYSIDKGMFVNTYNCTNGQKHTMIKSLVFSCSDTIDYVIVDTSKDIKGFSCAETLEEIYEDSSYTYYLSCMKSQYIEVMYSNGAKEKLTTALKLKNVTISDLDRFDIDYIRYNKYRIN